MARLLQDGTAPPEVVAAHLMSSVPDGSAASARTLEEAARRARATGAPDRATAWLRRALLEGPEPSLRSRLLAHLAVASAAAGDPGWAEDLARHLRAVEHGHEAAETRLKVGRVLMGRGELAAATEVLTAALDDAAAADLEELRLQLLATLGTNNRLDVSSRLDLGAELEAALEGVDVSRSPAARAVLSQLGYDRSLAGRPAATVRTMVRQAILQPSITDDEVLDNVAYYQALLALHFADDAEAMEEGAARGLAVAERRGNQSFFSLMSNLRGTLRLSQGRIDEAIDDHTAAVRTMRLDRTVTLPGAAGNLALGRAARRVPSGARGARPERRSEGQRDQRQLHPLPLRTGLRAAGGGRRARHR